MAAEVLRRTRLGTCISYIDDEDNRVFVIPKSLLRVYYGAADTVVALATTTIGDLLAACRE